MSNASRPALRARGLGIAEPARHGVHVAELLERAPSLVLLAPPRARGQPDREGLREVLVGMLLRVPARDVADELAGEGDRTIVVAVGAVVLAKDRAPLGGGIEDMGIVERMSSLVAQVHHDLALVLQVVHQLLEGGDLRAGQVKGDPDDRLAGRAAPLVGEIADGTEAPEALAVELTVELLDEPLDRRALQPQPQLLDALAQKLLDLGRGLLERLHDC